MRQNNKTSFRLCIFKWPFPGRFSLITFDSKEIKPRTLSELSHNHNPSFRLCFFDSIKTNCVIIA